MSQATDRRLLTIPEVAERLQMTPDGVYKLIQRGKLEAVRLSARKTRVVEGSLERYAEASQAWVDRYLESEPGVDTQALRAAFTAETGMTPEDWVAAWKRDAFADTAENMRLLVRAVGARGVRDEVPSAHPDACPPVKVAFAKRS